MYVCIYVCVYVCIYVCVYVCIYVCVCMYVCMYMYVCLYVCVCMYVCECMCVNVCVYVCMYVCVCMYTGKYVHIHIHTRTHVVSLVTSSWYKNRFIRSASWCLLVTPVCEQQHFTWCHLSLFILANSVPVFVVVGIPKFKMAFGNFSCMYVLCGTSNVTDL
jgi:nuclear pore complex protein Nup62